MSDTAIVALDDFEGVEKGVITLTRLAKVARMQRHFLIYPPMPAQLEKRGFTAPSLTAVLASISLFEFTKQ